MNNPFSEVLLHDEGLITDRLLIYYRLLLNLPPLDSVYYAKLNGPRWVKGWPRLSGGAQG